MSTYPREHREHREHRGWATTRLEAPSFTPEEFAKLVALHDRSRSIDIELGLDEQRLRFARWLVEHGKLSEEL